MNLLCRQDGDVDYYLELVIILLLLLALPRCPGPCACSARRPAADVQAGSRKAARSNSPGAACELGSAGTGQPCTRRCPAGHGGEREHARPGITRRRPFPRLFLMNAEISVIYCQEHEKGKKKKKKSGSGGRGREGHSSFFLLTPLAAFGYRISLNGNLHAAFIFKPLIAFYVTSLYMSNFSQEAVFFRPFDVRLLPLTPLRAKKWEAFSSQGDFIFFPCDTAAGSLSQARGPCGVNGTALATRPQGESWRSLL